MEFTRIYVNFNVSAFCFNIKWREKEDILTIQKLILVFWVLKSCQHCKCSVALPQGAIYIYIYIYIYGLVCSVCLRYFLIILAYFFNRLKIEK